MKTDDLLTLLASGAGPAEPGVLRRRLAFALAIGLAGAAALLLPLLGLNEALAHDAAKPMFWVKLGFAALLAAGATFAVARLSRPGEPLGVVPVTLAMPLAALWLLAALVVGDSESGARAALVFGQTWMACPVLIAGLSLPAFGALLWALRGLAPTRLRLAGAAAGLLAGALGALVYALHCPELAAPFIAVWYVLGMLLPAALGALLGPRVLAW